MGEVEVEVGERVGERGRRGGERNDSIVLNWCVGRGDGGGGGIGAMGDVGVAGWLEITNGVR